MTNPRGRPRLDPQTNEQIRVWYRVPGEMKREIEGMARRNDETVSEFVRRAVETELEKSR